jgi:hypothetical protein
MLFSWRRHIVLPSLVILGIFFLSASGGFGNPNAKGMGYHEVTFYVA